MSMSTEAFLLGWRRRLMALWYVLIVVVMVLSLNPKFGPPSTMYADKWSHVLAYATLGGLPFLAFVTRRAALIGAVAMVPLGLAIEIAQEWVPGRNADVLDFCADTVGVVIGIALGPWLWRQVSAFLARGRARPRP